MRHIFRFVILFVVWFLLSGHTSGLMLGFGVGSCLLVVLIWGRMDRVDGERVVLPFQWLRLPGYLAWLGKEIVMSNVDVAKAIVAPRLEISPTMTRVESSQQSLAGHVLFANSITLTPGTVSMNLRRDTVLVHALTYAGAEALLEGEMDRRVSALEHGAQETQS